MKNINRIVISITLLIITLTFLGCSNNNLDIDNSDTYIFGQDSQETFIAYQSRAYLAESEDSIYYINSDNGFLYVIDKETHNCLPLCNKSDCLHDKETSDSKKQKCNAFLGLCPSNNISYYNNKIYFNKKTEYKDKDGVSYTAYEIYKLSLDGTKRELVYSTTEFYIWNFKIHRGYIFFEASKYDEEVGFSGSSSALYKVSVDGNSEAEEVLAYYKYGIQINMIVMDTRFYGNHIFLLIDYIDTDNNSTESRYLINYDLQTDEWENLSEKLDINIESMFTIFNNKIVFSNKSRIYECNFDGSNEKEILNCTDILDGYQYYNPLTNDGENLIITPCNDEDVSEYLIFCNSDYEPSVHKMPFAFLAETGCNKESLIIYSSNDCILYNIDKSKLSVNTQTNTLYTFENLE